MLKQYSVGICGLLPGLLLSNGQMADPECPYVAGLDELRAKKAAGAEVERQRREASVTGRLYLNAQGAIILAAAMLESALRKGAAAVKRRVGRSWWAGLTVLDDASIRCDGLPAWDQLHAHDAFVYRSMARNADGSPSPRCRPFFKCWSATVLVEIDTDVLDATILEQIFTATGRQVGLGDWRPSSPNNPGKFGRVDVLSVVQVADQGRPTVAA